MPLSPISFNHVKINSAFWNPRLDTARKVTVRACLDRCEETERLLNFRRAAGLADGEHKGLCYDDSDVYKVLEGAAYDIASAPDPELEARVDGIIADICAAQEPSGYINTYFTLCRPEDKWTDMDQHEAYCIGHMVEAAVAYHQATGKDALLRCAERAVRHMMDVFGPGKRSWICGHQELELALVKLSRHTGEKAYFDFARWLIHQRGHSTMQARSLDSGRFDFAYYMDAIPATELQKVTGHAVRAMYYFTAMADIDAVTGEGEFNTALDALWSDIYPANTYITGGIGQQARNEGFTHAYHKPNLTAYCETCAAIGMALWNHRLNLAKADAKYADLVETEMYNGILSGISLSGDLYFYENPLASVGTHHRSRWFGTSCCPSNLARFIPSVGGYCYALQDDALIVNQYIGSTLTLNDGTHALDVSVATEYPWDGRITIDVRRAEGVSALKLRIPGWCRAYAVSCGASEIESGYITVPVSAGDCIVLTLDMPIDRVYEDPRVCETAGRVCIRRGPVVYCAEETDNLDLGLCTEYLHADALLSRSAPLWLGDPDPQLLNAPTIETDTLRLIPYSLWDNREPGAMVVWLKET